MNSTIRKLLTFIVNRCITSDGTKSPPCVVDNDECTEDPGICQNNGTCINIAGSYICVCEAGYTGRNCLKNIDDCKTDDGSSKCLNNGTCIDGVGRFSCECQDPYIGMMNILFLSFTVRYMLPIRNNTYIHIKHGRAVVTSPLDSDTIHERISTSPD